MLTDFIKKQLNQYADGNISNIHQERIHGIEF